MKQDIYEVYEKVSTSGIDEVNNLERVFKVIGYDSLEEFLVDNPGAVESILKFIQDAKVDEWDELVEEFLIEDDYTHEEAE